MKLALAIALVLAVPAVSAADPVPPRPRVEVSLPAPTGPFPLGTMSLRLLDRTRADPLRIPVQPFRELMVSVVYPARDTARYPLAPHLEPGAATAFDELVAPTGPRVVDWAGTRSHAHLGAPAELRGGPRPVVLYSPGVGDPRTWNTTQVEDLASRGYVVVTLDHTYDSAGVEFPGQRVERSVLPDRPITDELIRTVYGTRVADTRFVLDQLPFIGACVLGSRTLMDLGKVGMFGHSGGGSAALQVLHDDPRLKAAINLDGQLSIGQEDDGSNPASVATAGVTRPFLLLGSEPGGHAKRPSWGLLWKNSPGWHADLYLKNSAHASFTDAEALLPQLGTDVSGVIGTVEPARAIAANRAYTAAFFDRFLRHRDDHLLDAPFPAFPDVEFVR